MRGQHIRLNLLGGIMRIVIVEDDVIPANYLKKILELEGHEVIAMIASGVEAIEITKREKPDLIFMDVMLKDHISGAEAATRIHYAYPEILIVFLTAYSDKEMINYAVESEAFAYLLKPYRDQEILATLKLANARLATDKKPINDKKTFLENKIYLADGYIYDSQIKRLFLHDKEVALGSKALQLIELLCQNKHITLEVDVIIETLWDSPKSSQALRSLVHRIREATTQNIILNKNSFGYKIGLLEKHS